MFDRIKKLPPLFCVTAELLIFSIAAFAAVFFLGRSAKTPEKAQIKAEIIAPSSEGGAAALTDSGKIERFRGVRITDGEGYVWFKITLLDSGGVTLAERLKEKDEEIAVFKEYLSDPEMPSFEAFNDEYHQLLNERERLKLKGKAALAAFCRSADGGDLADNVDFICADEDEDNFSCTLIYNKKLKKGDVAELYSEISLPGEKSDTEYDAYVKNEDSSYRIERVKITASELLGAGFGINVTAVTAPSDGSDCAYSAYMTN